MVLLKGHVYFLKTAFLSFDTMYILGWIILCCRDCLVHRRIFINISGLLTGCHLHPASHNNPKYLQTWSKFSVCCLCVCVELFGNHHPLKNRCLNILSLYLPLTGEMSLCLGYETKMCDHGYYNRICLFNSNDNISNIYAFIVPTMLSTLPIFCPQTQRRKVLLISLLFKLKHNRLNDLPKIKHFLLLF